MNHRRREDCEPALRRALDASAAWHAKLALLRALRASPNAPVFTPDTDIAQQLVRRGLIVADGTGWRLANDDAGVSVDLEIALMEAFNAMQLRWLSSDRAQLAAILSRRR